MAANGSYKNPSDKNCWETCSSCLRCKNKGRYTKCNSCSGRHDLFGKTDTDNLDFCDCANGILRWKTQQGKLVIRPMTKNPFKGEVIMQKTSQDEQDWESYLRDMREKFDNEDWNPVRITETRNKMNSGFKQLGNG